MNLPTFSLPDGITRASLGRKMSSFSERRNYLDLQWHRQRGLWAQVINAERGGGVVREGNLLDWRFTQFPQVMSHFSPFLSQSPLQTKSAWLMFSKLSSLFNA